ncbi:MAG: glycosyltransferase, partial [Chloroflexi bacterium]|nr:glycosyltransferase [Chloroflexota bacterium]
MSNVTRAFNPFRKVLVPILHGYASDSALAAARTIAGEGRIVLVGLVGVPGGESLSAAAGSAREVRRLLRALSRADAGRTRIKARVRVSYSPWEELLEVIAEERPDLLLLEWPRHFEALGVTPEAALTVPPCDVALVRGPIPGDLSRILVPLRDSPSAPLALRLSLCVTPGAAPTIRTLHLLPFRSAGRAVSDGRGPSPGFDRVLRELPEVSHYEVTTGDPTRAIISEAHGYDLVVMGASAHPVHATPPLDEVARQVLAAGACPAAVIAVKTARPVLPAMERHAAGALAISILVDKWFAENTYDADEFADLGLLLALKRRQNLTISLALPALNEEETVGQVIRTVQKALMEETPLLDEIVLIDSNSTDRTREIARELGVPVYIHQQILAQHGARPGKGEALWKSLYVTRGDLVVWIDTDIVNIHPRFVYGILGPLLLSPRIQFVKGFYRRPLRVGGKVQAGGGGRVTELTARQNNAPNLLIQAGIAIVIFAAL